MNRARIRIQTVSSVTGLNSKRSGQMTTNKFAATLRKKRGCLEGAQLQPRRNEKGFVTGLDFSRAETWANWNLGFSP